MVDHDHEPLPASVSTPIHPTDHDLLRYTLTRVTSIAMPPPLKKEKSTDAAAKLRRYRLLVKTSIWVFLGLTAYQVLWSYWLAGINVPDYEIDKMTGQKRIRRRPDLLVKHDHLLGRQVPK